MMLLLLFLVCCALLLVLGEDKIAPNEEEDTPTSADILRFFMPKMLTKDENFFDSPFVNFWNLRKFNTTQD